MHFSSGKSRVALVGLHCAVRVMTSMRGTTHLTCAGSWACPPHFLQKLFLRLMQIQSTKDKTCTCEHYCIFIIAGVGTSTVQQVRHVRCDTRHTRHVMRVVSWQGFWGCQFFIEMVLLICAVFCCFYRDVTLSTLWRRKFLVKLPASSKTSISIWTTAAQWIHRQPRILVSLPCLLCCHMLASENRV